ncbi:MAG: hypothetical protein IJ876_05680 [Elusimicrobiaceae bacterium]|nr:hypothetical protein [Elusimicrobiaceae bacterium]
MKKICLICISWMLLPGAVQGLTFQVSDIRPSHDPDVQHLVPLQDLNGDPTAVLFVKTDILGVKMTGNIIDRPRPTREGYVVFITQGTKMLQFIAPHYTTFMAHFSEVEGGQYYEISLTTQEGADMVAQAAQQASHLDIDHTQVEVSLDVASTDLAASGYAHDKALVYLDSSLDFSQWKKLLVPNGPYEPYDIYGNKKNPCCLRIPAGEPVENIFRMRILGLDTAVENFEPNAAYHTTLKLIPKNN